MGSVIVIVVLALLFAISLHPLWMPYVFPTERELRERRLKKQPPIPEKRRARYKST